MRGGELKVVVNNKRTKPTRHVAAAEACGDVLKYTSRLVSCFAYYLFVCRTSLSLEQLSFHIFRRGYKSRFLFSPPVPAALRAHPQIKGEFPSLNACLYC